VVPHRSALHVRHKHEAIVNHQCEGGGQEKVVFCMSCGNNVHEECFRRWAASKRQKGMTVTCVWCRAPWSSTDPLEPTKQGASSYLNLASVSRAHQSGTSMEELYGDTFSWIRRRGAY
jgi:hypothetical protein